MAYSAPYTFTALELLTAAKMNAIQTNITALWVGTTAGDMEYYVSSSAKQRLAIGASGSYLDSTGSAIQWTKFYRSMTVMLNADVALTIGDDAYRWRVPASINGWNLYSVAAGRKAGTGTLTIQIRNVYVGVDILSTKLTVDSGENDSSTAAVAAVINTANDGVGTGQYLAIDIVDPGINTYYAVVELVFAKP